MSIELISDPQRWNDFVVGSGKGHLLQSFEWGQLKAKFGWEAERVALTERGSIVAGAQVLFRRTPLGQMAYVPRGPVTSSGDEAELGALVETIHELARDRRALLLKVEPNECSPPELTSLGFTPSLQSVQPRTTIHIDLTPSLDTLASHLLPKTRYGIRTAIRRGVTVRQGDIESLPAFYELLKVTSQRDGFTIHDYDYYKEAVNTLGDRIRILSAFFEEEMLASIIVMAFAGEAIYMYAASSNTRRELQPNYLLQWEAITWAKSAGYTRYDLWGIPNEVWDIELRQDGNGSAEVGYQPGQRKGLWGVYHFKRGFGGATVRYAGAYDYVYSAPRYWAWQKVLPLIPSWPAGLQPSSNARDSSA